MADQTRMPNDTIYVERDGAVARVVFDQPESGNPLNAECKEDFIEAMDRLKRDAEVRVVALKANGRGLSAGGDLRTMPEYLEMDAHADRAHIAEIGDFFFRHLYQFPKPTVLKAHGFAVAGGLCLVAAADVVIAEDDAVFGLPEARMWGWDGFLGFWALTLGVRWTKLLLFTGDSIDGRTAERLGMVTKSVPLEELDDYVDWIAARIANVDGQILTLQKQAVNAALNIFGVDAAYRIGQAYSHMSHVNPVSREFMTRIGRDGVRETIEWRDAPFGGPQRRGGWLPLVHGPKPPDPAE